MKWLLYTLLMLLQTMNAQAIVVQQELGDNFRLLSIDTNVQLKRTKGYYAVNISHQGKNIGLVKDFYHGNSWRSSLGLLMADEFIELSTGRSDVTIGNRSIDLNQYLGVHAEFKFFEITPFASIAYQFRNADNDMVFDFITGLKLLKLDDSRIRFNQELGILLENSPEISTRLKQETLQDLQQYYLLPVIDFRFNYSF